jgi:hypothetical protein
VFAPIRPDYVPDTMYYDAHHHAIFTNAEAFTNICTCVNYGSIVCAQPAPPLGQERARPAILEVVGDGGWERIERKSLQGGPKETVHERQDPTGIVEVQLRLTMCRRLLLA